jgi:hypothetical protein
MNGRLCLAIIHHFLQDEIEMFTMHPLPQLPKEPAIICMKSTQMQLKKFPIVTYIVLC